MSPSKPAPAVHLEPWAPLDLRLLVKLVGNPAMMAHLGGPEAPQLIASRHERYLQAGPRGAGKIFKIVDDATGAGIGSVGYWPRRWQGRDVYETGWSVLPEYQGRGAGSAATVQMVELARADHGHRFLHAFPSIDNGPSTTALRMQSAEKSAFACSASASSSTHPAA